MTTPTRIVVYVSLVASVVVAVAKFLGVPRDRDDGESESDGPGDTDHGR